MSSNNPTLLPMEESYSTAYSPTSPTTRNRRSRSPRPVSRASPSRVIRWPLLRSYLTPKVLTTVILWSSVVYLIHTFVIPLPIPQLPARTPKPAAEKYFLSSSFPPPSNRPGDSLDSVDPRYRPHLPLDPPDAPFPRLRPTRFLSPRCMEQWFADGETSCGAAELGKEEQLDAVWLWVNGTDPRWRATLIQARKESGVYSPEHHFRYVASNAGLTGREQNELLYSMRSVLQAMGSKVKAFHLITADFPFEEEDVAILPPGFEDVDHTAWRVAQAPVWLDYSKREGKPALRYTSHSEIYHLPTFDRNGKTEELGEHEWREKQWRDKALPSFNSMSIESRVGWVQGLTDVALSLNDDFFLLRPHAVSPWIWEC